MLSFAEISLSFKNARDEKKFIGLDKVWQYLEARGVSRATADACGLHIMQAVELIAAARRSPDVRAADNRAAVVFPHYRMGAMDEPIEWWSARLVSLADPAKELRVVASFGDLVDQSKIKTPGKMFCPPNEYPHAYLPPIYDWSKLQRGQRVYIHESAIKSINGAVLDTASVGLNGVWGWRSKKHSIALVEEMRDLPWKALELNPVIVFDSNANDNWQVQEAESRLAAKIYELTGRMASALRVPKGPENTDQGFDDYRVRVGDVAAREFLDGAGTIIDINEIELMKIELNTLVCVVRSMGAIAEQRTATVMGSNTFTGVNYAHYTSEIEDDNGRSRTVNVPRLWLADARRAEVEKLEYLPGAPRLVPSRTRELPNLNTWNASDLLPESGDVDAWLELLVSGVPDEDMQQWLIAWCAYPLQNLGKKMASYPLVFGPSGTGKNLFFKPLHAIYGHNAVLIGKEQILSNFNSVYAQKQFVHIDELQRAKGDDAVTQKIKMLTTSERLVVNTKGVQEYEVNNCANLAITSNYWDCIKLDADDRRACVLRWDPALTGVDHRGDQEYWAKYVQWTEHGGSAALFYWLLRQDIRWFDPNAWAPASKWKGHVTEATRSALESWVNDLWVDSTEVLPMGGNGRCLYTAKELCVLFYGQGESELTPGQVKNMTNELRNKGFNQAHNGALIRRTGDVAARFWVVSRRDESWDLSACTRHFKLTGA
jgi:hypothetical protein